MKQLIISSLLLIGTVTIKAQITQNRDVKPFKKIEVSGAASVIYTQSDTSKLKVIADADEINNVYTTYEGDVLTIKAKGNFSHPYKIYVDGNMLSHVACSGASKFSTTNIWTGDSLSIDASGASDVEANIKSNVMNAMLSGASGANLEGNTNKLYSTVSGASALKAYKLNSVTANITASGASSAKLLATEKINANATGSSSIKFRGDPTDVNAEASSSSSISKVVGDLYKKTDDSKKDSTVFNFKKKKYVIISKDKDSESTVSVNNRSEEFKHWQGIGLGFNSFSSTMGGFALDKANNNMDLKISKSTSLYFNAFQKNFHLYKNYINLVTGLGIQWNAYNFDKRVTLKADSSYTYGRIDSLSTINYRTNALRNTYLNVPLLLEFNTNSNPKKAFHIAFGAIAGIKLGSRTKQEFTMNSDRYKIIRKDDFNQNFFRVNAHASIGYSRFTVFGDYALTPLFESGKGPELYPFTFGVRIVPF